MEVAVTNKPSSGSWWSTLGFGKAAPAPQTDYADLGTAFGLDASFGPRAQPDANDCTRNDKGRPPSPGAGPTRKR
jgi:hypothetical protein